MYGEAVLSIHGIYLQKKWKLNAMTYKLDEERMFTG